MMGFTSKQIPAGGDCWALPSGDHRGRLLRLTPGSAGRGDEPCPCCSVTPSTPLCLYSDFWFLLRSPLTQMRLPENPSGNPPSWEVRGERG